MKLKHIPIPIGKNIGRLRREKGWSQYGLAKKIGATRSCIATYEMGTRRPPAAKIVALAKLFGVNVNVLFGNTQGRKGEKAQRDLSLWKRFNRIQQLTPRKRKAILKVIDSLLSKEKR